MRCVGVFVYTNNKVNNANKLLIKYEAMHAQVTVMIIIDLNICQ